MLTFSCVSATTHLRPGRLSWVVPILLWCGAVFLSRLVVLFSPLGWCCLLLPLVGWCCSSIPLPSVGWWCFDSLVPFGGASSGGAASTSFGLVLLSPLVPIWVVLMTLLFLSGVPPFGGEGRKEGGEEGGEGARRVPPSSLAGRAASSPPPFGKVVLSLFSPSGCCFLPCFFGMVLSSSSSHCGVMLLPLPLRVHLMTYINNM